MRRGAARLRQLIRFVTRLLSDACPTSSARRTVDPVRASQRVRMLARSGAPEVIRTPNVGRRGAAGEALLPWHVAERNPRAVRRVGDAQRDARAPRPAHVGASEGRGVASAGSNASGVGRTTVRWRSTSSCALMSSSRGTDIVPSDGSSHRRAGLALRSFVPPPTRLVTPGRVWAAIWVTRPRRASMFAHTLARRDAPAARVELLSSLAP